MLSSYFVNMTNAGGEAVEGYMADVGAAYGDRADRGNAGVEYGWVNSAGGAPVDNTTFSRDRDSANAPATPGTPINELYDSFNHMQRGAAPYSWEIAVPNGLYRVHTASGDPTAVDSRYQLRVEGVQIYDVTPVAPNYWGEGTVEVTVTDGRLTVSTGPSATNAKLNFVEVTSIDTPPAEAPVLQALPATGRVTLSWNRIPGAQTYNLYRGTAPGNATLYQTGLTGTTYNDTAVTVANTYYYYLVPANAHGVGPQSNEVNYQVSATYAHINFQPGTTANPTPAGYLKDSGGAFGDRGNGFTYGWWNAADGVTASPTANGSTRERVNAASPDQRYDTLVQFHQGGSPPTGPVWWEASVPNGTYLVRVVAGDPSNSDSFYSFLAEADKVGGVPQVNGSGVSMIHYNANGTTGLARFADSGFMQVTVTDGNLTISEGPDAANNKIAFIDIDTLTVAAPPANPTGLTVTNVRASQLTLNWTDAAANETGFRIEQSTDGGATFTPVATAPSRAGTGTVSYVVAGLNPTTQYQYRVYALNLQGDSTSPTNTASATTAAVTGGISGYVAPTTGEINLSGEGTVDWAHWGSVDANTFEHKAGVPSAISNVTPVGSSPKVLLTNSPTTFSWTDGTVTGTTTATPNTLGTQSWGHGFTFTVPADTTQRTLRVYVGVNNLRGQILARLSDGSAPDYVDSSITSAALADGVYTLTYSAASAGQTLSVTWIELPNNGDQINGRLSLKAATLQVPQTTTGTAGSVVATPLNSGRVQLTWADGATNEIGYFVERAPDAGGAPGTFARVGQVEGGATRFLDNGTLGVAGTKFHYRLVPYNIAQTGGTASAAVSVTTATGLGTGARATYFDAPTIADGDNNPTFGDAWATTSIDPTIDFNYGTAAPAGAGAGFGADTFGVRWSAQVKPEFTGEYVFTAAADDGYRLWVNGVKVLDGLGRRGGLGTFFDGTPVTLIAGKMYDIVYEVVENGGDAGGRLYWSAAGLPREIVPQAALYPGVADGEVVPKVSAVVPDGLLPVTAVYDTHQQLSLRFSENVGDSLDAYDVTIQSLAPGGPTYDGSSFRLVWDAPSNSALIYFDNLPNQKLPDGHYRVTVSGAGGVTDGFGNTLDGDGDGAAGGDYVVDVTVFAGDATNDGKVDFNDLVVLAQNYDTTGKTYAQGDFNYDGAVDFNDLVILAQRYETAIPAPAAPVAASPAPAAGSTVTAQSLAKAMGLSIPATSVVATPVAKPAPAPVARPTPKPVVKKSAAPAPAPRVASAPVKQASKPVAVTAAPSRLFATKKIAGAKDLLA
jgi:fibronectin type 3 domain-containing protein